MSYLEGHNLHEIVGGYNTTTPPTENAEEIKNGKLKWEKQCTYSKYSWRHDCWHTSRIQRL